jgi:hypothetical protein
VRRSSVNYVCEPADAFEFIGAVSYGLRVIATSYRYIVRRAGMRSATHREGTRIGVHDVVAMIKTGLPLIRL